MGFIGSYITPIPDITSEDLTEAYYLIEDLKHTLQYDSDNDIEYINVIIGFSIYPSKTERLQRTNKLGGDTVNTKIAKSELIGNILSDYYICAKPILISVMESILKNKLNLDILDEIPEEYSLYHYLSDDI